MSAVKQTKVTDDSGIIYSFSGSPATKVPAKVGTMIFTPVGEPTIIKAKLSFSEDGEKIAEPGEKFDLNAFIQASRESCDIAAIIAKYQAGDESVLNVNPNSFYGDSTQLPKDLYDVKRMNDLYDDVQRSFASLPEELQGLFNNDYAEFLNSILNNKANDIIKKYHDDKKAAEEAAASQGGNE